MKISNARKTWPMEGPKIYQFAGFRMEKVWEFLFHPKSSKLKIRMSTTVYHMNLCIEREPGAIKQVRSCQGHSGRHGGPGLLLWDGGPKKITTLLSFQILRWYSKKMNKDSLRKILNPPLGHAQGAPVVHTKRSVLFHNKNVFLRFAVIWLSVLHSFRAFQSLLFIFCTMPNTLFNRKRCGPDCSQFLICCLKMTFLYSPTEMKSNMHSTSKPEIFAFRFSVSL